MKALILNNLLYMKQTLKNYIFIFILFLGIGFISGNPMFITTILIIGLNQTMTSMSYDENYKWNEFALTMPVSPKKIVISKFLFSYGILVISGIIALIFGLILGLFSQTPAFDEILISIVGTLIAASYLINSIIPLIYKFGIEKSRILFFTIILIPTFLIMILGKLGMITEASLITFFKLSPFFIIIYSIFCIATSIKIFENKDL